MPKQLALMWMKRPGLWINSIKFPGTENWAKNCMKNFVGADFCICLIASIDDTYADENNVDEKMK